MWRLSIGLTALLVLACSSDTELNFQYLIGTWNTPIVTDEGQEVGTAHYVFDRPNSEGFGMSYQVISDSSGLSVFKHEYRITRTNNSGRIVYYERNAIAGWIPVKFEIVDDAAQQAIIDKHAWNKVFDKDENDRIHQAILDNAGR